MGRRVGNSNWRILWEQVQPASFCFPSGLPHLPERAAPAVPRLEFTNAPEKTDQAFLCMRPGVPRDGSSRHRGGKHGFRWPRPNPCRLGFRAWAPPTVAARTKPAPVHRC